MGPNFEKGKHKSYIYQYMNKISNFFRKSIGVFDWYSDQPRLRSNGYSKFTSMCGMVLSVLFLLAALLIFAPVFSKYVRREYLQQTVISSANLSSSDTYFVTGRDFFWAVSVRRRNDSQEVDMTEPLNSFMKVEVVQYQDLITPNRKRLPVEQCPAGYMGNFKQGVPLQYCLKPIDRLNINMHILHSMVTMLFMPECKIGVSCNYATFSSTVSSFNSFWLNHFVTVYYTTRSLDVNGNIEFSVHSENGNENLADLGNSVYLVNIPTIYLLKTEYDIDNEVLWTRKSRKIELEGTGGRIINSFLPTMYWYFAGVEGGIGLQPRVIRIYRYKTKLDEVIWKIGGGTFLLFVAFSWLGFRINRYLKRQNLVKQNWLLIQGNQAEIPSLTLCDQIAFYFYDLFYAICPARHDLDPNATNSLGQRYHNYRQLYRQVINNDTNIVNFLKCARVIMRNYGEVSTTYMENFRENRRPKVSSEKANEEIVKKLKIMGWGQLEYCDTQNLWSGNRVRFIEETDAYKLVFEGVAPNPTDPLPLPQVRENREKQSCSKFKFFMEWLDAYKVQPRFRTINRRKSVLAGCCTITSIILSILLLSSMFGYFVNRTPRVSTDLKALPLDKFNFSAVMGKDFKMGLGFIDPSTGLVTALTSQMNSYLSIQLIQYERNGLNSPMRSSATQLKVLSASGINSTEFFERQVRSDYLNSYILPQGRTVEVTGSPTTPVEKYFSIKVRQTCKQGDELQCKSNFNQYRNNTMGIISTYTFMLILTKGSINPITKQLEPLMLLGGTFRIRKPFFNSSVEDVVEINKFSLYDDTGLDQGPVLVKTTMHTEQYYNPTTNIQPNDGSQVYYQISIRPSGLQYRTTLRAIKGFQMLSSLGGVLVFMFFLFALIAKPYSHLVQNLQISSEIYRSQKGKLKLGHSDTFQYSFYYFLSKLFCLKPCIDRSSQLGQVHRLCEEIQDKTSLEKIIKRCNTSLRLMSKIENDEAKRQVNTIYLRYMVDKDILEKINRATGVGVEEELGVRGQQQGALREMDNLTPRRNGVSTLDLNAGSHSHINNQNDDISIGDEPISKDPLVEQEKDNTEHISGNGRQAETATFERKSVPKLPHPHPYCQRQNLSTQNCVTSLLDFFGVQGQLTYNGTTRFGSVFGGILTFLTMVAIAAITHHFVGVYLSPDNYFTTRADDVSEAINYKQTFEFGKNARMAVGFINASMPYLANISEAWESRGEVLLVQSTIDRRNPNQSKYSESVVPLVRCPSNYLNSKGFKFEDFGQPQRIERGYCVPDSTTVQLSGNIDSQIQKWFYLTVRAKCGATPTGCNSSDRTSTMQFFNNITVMVYLSDPNIGTLPITYDFQRLPLGRLINSRNTVQNVTLDKLTLIQDHSMLSEPRVTDTYDYTYLGSQDFYMSYLDTRTLFKNASFEARFNEIKIVRTYYKPDEVLGLVGGVAFFIVLVTRWIGRRFNKLKMYVRLGDEMMWSSEEAQHLNDDMDKPKARKKMLELTDWEVFKFSMFSFLYEGCCACFKDDLRYKQAMILRANIQYELDLARLMRTLNYSRFRQSQTFMPKQQGIVDIHIKKVMHKTTINKDEILDGLNFDSRTKLRELAEHNGLSDSEVIAICRAVQAGGKVEDILKDSQFSGLRAAKMGSAEHKVGSAEEPLRHARPRQLPHIDLPEFKRKRQSRSKNSEKIEDTPPKKTSQQPNSQLFRFNDDSNEI